MRAVKIRNWLVIALVALLCAIAVVQNIRTQPAAAPSPEAIPAMEQQSAGATFETVKAGAAAPAFSLKDEDGNAYAVGGPRSKPVILNFWASWCGPCQEEAPALNDLAAKYKDAVDVYGINVTSNDYKPNAERFVRKYGLTFPVMYDRTGDIFDLYHGAAYPTNVLIDTQGRIVEVIIGALTAEELEQKFAALAKGVKPDKAG
ncbi:TlpA disulfide reductase family protein [Paenibacillus sp. NFR01]|uniref:TlpA family protein disulfide reductase n=1 Tax=Paenibacillus sp. NFR01 TaxID=1566279 RepID=UPI0008BE0C17|nr:TlpA disulfide reductase family protein [Paenibacillus sp. NFR01]SET01375.1 Peroxiredoxin [Paenibacillus sp. NFR01]